MGIRKLSIILMILISGTCLAQEDRPSMHNSPFDFYREKITLSVNDSFVSIVGTYYFRNNTGHEGKVPILFPFYIDSTSLFPDSIEVYTVDRGDTITLDFANRENSILIGIPLTPQQVTIWHLDYRQKILDTRATYILTSTAAWGKPIENAVYEFIVPDSFKNVSTWPEADTVIVYGNLREYRALRSDFMPTKNMEIEWDLK